MRRKVALGSVLVVMNGTGPTREGYMVTLGVVEVGVEAGHDEMCLYIHAIHATESRIF